MARKNLPYNINRLRRRGENIFKMPLGPRRAARRPKWQKITARGLKPNTKYKVMLDNQEGNKFEDITAFSKPLGTSIKVNPRVKTSGNKPTRATYLKTDSRGNLTLKTKPFGTDEAVVTGANTSTGSVSYTNVWKFHHTRNVKNDRGRDKIKLIAYNAIDNPEAPDKIKTLKKEVQTLTRPTGKATTRPKKNVEKYLPPGIIVDATPIRENQVGPSKKVEIETRTDFYQTFYVDAETVDGSDTVDLTDISIYVRSKPRRKSNISGREAPGVNMVLLNCDEDGTPNIQERVGGSFVSLDYHQISASPLATTETIFKFESPVTVKTNAYYAIALMAEDQGYVFWDNRKGDYVLKDGAKTEVRSQGSSAGHKGDMYFFNAQASRKRKQKAGWVPKNDLDLKFDVNIAEYAVANVDVTLVNGSYEFFSLSSSGDGWIPGEDVYKVSANIAGGVTMSAGSNKITGSGTDFTTLNEGQKLVLIDSTDTSIQEVFTVDRSIAGTATTLYVVEDSDIDISGNAVLTVVGELEWYDYNFKKIRLADSSVNYTEYVTDSGSNTHFIFQAGDTIKGAESGTTATISSYDELGVSVFRGEMDATVPPAFNLTTQYDFSYQTTANNEIYKLGTDSKQFMLNKPNHVKGYAGYVISKSQEVNMADSTMVANDSKSSKIVLNYEYKGANTRSYSCPTINLNELEMITHQWRINNTETNEWKNIGDATTRHISQTLHMGEGSGAEDIRVILNAYRPRGTDIAVYAKLMNVEDSDDFEGKQWTKLKAISGKEIFSDVNLDRFGYHEMHFELDDYTAAEQTLAGTFTVNANGTLNTTTANVELVVPTDIIRIYSPLFEENYQLFAVESINATADTIDVVGSIANVNLLGEGFKIDVLQAKEAAFKNRDNYNIARYFNSEGAAFDTFNMAAIKIVLLADDRKLVPRVDDYKVIGVTA